MLKIRLQRVGRKNIPTFRVILADHKNAAKGGKAKEVLGHYDPVNNNKEVKADRIKYWLSVGAQLSGTMHNWLVNEKIIPGKKINVLPKKKPIVSEEAKAAAEAAAKAAEAPASETPATESPVEEKKEETPEEQPAQ